MGVGHIFNLRQLPGENINLRIKYCQKVIAYTKVRNGEKS
jgi:hypothetical protein